MEKATQFDGDPEIRAAKIRL